MTECRFPFTVGGSGGAGGPDVRESNTQYLRIMEQIKASQWRLKDGRPDVSQPCQVFFQFMAVADICAWL